MPRKPKRPCSYPGCPKLVDGQFCKDHEKETNKTYEKYKRDPRTHKRYDRTWRRIRNKFIRQHPFCKKCFEEGRATLAEEVHHVLPLSDGGSHDESNLMSLCKSCHSKIHASGEDKIF